MLLTDVMLYLMKGTLTNIRGVLKGDGKSISEVGIDDSTLTDDNNHIPTSGVVKSALGGIVKSDAVSSSISFAANSGTFIAVARNSVSVGALYVVDAAGSLTRIAGTATGHTASINNGTVTITNTSGIVITVSRILRL